VNACPRLGEPMRRRQFITLLGVVAAWPLAARAQQGERMRHVGMLLPFSGRDVEAQSQVTAFRERLLQLGWTDGRNVRIDYRWSTGDLGLIAMAAKELVALQPDVILAT
jgi:putative ABC transport system substrate-binding protein